MLSAHPANPQRRYLAWQRKVKVQLDELLAVPNPDTRTRGEIHKLQQRLQPQTRRNGQAR